MDEPGFFSRYGGLWIDRDDWRQRLSALALPDARRQEVEFFVEHGYLILEGAVEPARIDAFQREVERSFREGNDRLLFQRHGSGLTEPLDRPVDRLGTRIVDSFVALPEALDLFAAPRLLDFLALVLGEDPLLFQSLSFDQGSQQGLHQDTAYVVVDRPLELAACWIALEDVQPGSGELMYVPGSHRLPEFDFGGGTKHWSPDRDGRDPHERWSAQLREAAKAQGGAQLFRPKKGDVLVWHADLAHGGSPVSVPTLTRQSLVGHFCPQSARPRYFDHDQLRPTVRRHGRLAYSSGHYDLAAPDSAAA